MENLIFTHPDWAEELPAGWRAIFAREIKRISEILEHYSVAPELLVFAQVKEKFGEIRIYHDLNMDADCEAYDTVKTHVDAIIDELVAASALMCGDCGDFATYMSKGWTMPYCKKCAKAWLVRFRDMRKGEDAKFKDHFYRRKAI